MTETAPLVSIADVIAGVTHNYHPITVHGRRMDTFRPVTTNELLKIAKAHPGVLEFLHSAINSKGETKDYEEFGFVDLVLNAGPKACAALIAASAGLLHDEKFQAQLLDKPDDFTLPILNHVVVITLGGSSVHDFFMRTMSYFDMAQAFRKLDEKARKKPKKSAVTKWDTPGSPQTAL